MTPSIPSTTLPNHEERMRAAERIANWYLGDRGWAGKLVGAYLNPDAAIEALEREQRPEPRTEDDPGRHGYMKWKP